MFFKIFASMIKDTLSIKYECKYKIISMIEDVAHTKVICELLENGGIITLILQDIIKEGKLKYFNTEDIILLSSKIQENTLQNSSFITLRNNPYYLTITICFITCLLISNLAAIKMCNIFGHALDGGTIIFPLLYVLNDILTEVYGFTASRRVVWTGLFCNLMLTIILYSITYFPSLENYQGQQAFDEVFSISPRIFIASISAYLVGELMNATIISILKIKFRGKKFFLRAIVSTMIGSFIESMLFCYLAFSNQIILNQIFKMALLQTAIKISYEILIIPFTVRIVAFLKASIGQEIFEKPTLKSLIPNFIR